MKKILILALLVAVGGCARASSKSIHSKLESAVGTMSADHKDGRESSVCTATAFERSGDSYRVITAAHCVYLTAGVTGKYFLTFPYNQPEHVALKLEYIGPQFDEESTDPTDIAVFSYKSKVRRSVIPIGDVKKLHTGDKVAYIGNPGIYGMQWFEGFISRIKTADAVPGVTTRDWPREMLVQIGGGPGASGSALISVKQRAIVGILTGTQEDVNSTWFFPVPSYKGHLINPPRPVVEPVAVVKKVRIVVVE